MFCLFAITTKAQSTDDHYNFMGLIKLSESEFISYRLDFTIVDDVVKGYSVSDILGQHETKSEIEGYVDRDNSIVTIKETNLLYTKSPLDVDIFCNLEFKFDVKRKIKKLEIPFKGYYSTDHSDCIKGELILNNMVQFEKFYDKLIKKSKKLEAKGTISAEESSIVSENLGSITKNNVTLKSKENLSLIWSEETAQLDFWDDATFDKDKIEIKVNNKVVYKGIVKSEKQNLEIELEKGNNIIQIRAINEGEVGRNTVAFELSSESKSLLISNDLNKDETSKISLFKK